jgi:hypothetical protein
VTADCERFDGVVDDVAAGGELPPDLRPHVEACSACQARLTLARRLEHALATWPVEVPGRDFSMAVVRAARRDVWAQEVVVDWGFNLAIAGSVVAILGGILGLAWTLTAATDATTTVRLARETAGQLVDEALALAPVVGAATILLATALGGWWWAEQRDRW